MLNGSLWARGPTFAACGPLQLVNAASFSQCAVLRPRTRCSSMRRADSPGR